VTITTSSSVWVSVARSPQEVDNGKDDGHRLVDGIKEPDGGLGVVIVPSVGYLVIQLNSGVKTLKRKDLCGGEDADHLSLVGPSLLVNMESGVWVLSKFRAL
jgi:hypothetical protein